MPTSALLAATLRDVELRLSAERMRRDVSDSANAVVPWLECQSAPPALRRGSIHEWLGVAGPAAGDPDAADRASARCDDPGAEWTPAVAIATHVAMSAMQASVRAGGVAIWIGRRCWPYPHLLARAGAPLLARSLFVDPLDAGERVWAIDLALRCAAVSVVVADASGLDMASSRRLQLAAEAGAIAADRAGSAGGLGLLLRPGREVSSLSAARTRWLVRREPSSGSWPRWRIELLRDRSAGGVLGIGARSRDAGAAIDRGGINAWSVEWNRADAGVVVPAGMAGRTGEAPRASVGGGPGFGRLIA